LADSESLIAALPPDDHGLTFLPFISGERSLGWHANARMTISGISSHTAPADLLRAGKEAIAYQLRAVYDDMRDTLKVDGKLPNPRMVASGGALLGSPAFQGILADTLETPVYPSRDHEASARGVALLALEALGIIPDVAQVAPNLDNPVQPDPRNSEIYKKAMERQMKLYHMLLPS
ncbi:MAG TPA: carbohydrate kinase, partial [Ktedonobacter sp.]|nr:carbohydrate kinase [Ktedonobacter sp.]